MNDCCSPIYDVQIQTETLPLVGLRYLFALDPGSLDHFAPLGKLILNERGVLPGCDVGWVRATASVTFEKPTKARTVGPLSTEMARTGKDSKINPTTPPGACCGKLRHPQRSSHD
jgi:hypothetical protein